MGVTKAEKSRVIAVLGIWQHYVTWTFQGAEQIFFYAFTYKSIKEVKMTK